MWLRRVVYLGFSAFRIWGLFLAVSCVPGGLSIFRTRGTSGALGVIAQIAWFWGTVQWTD